MLGMAKPNSARATNNAPNNFARPGDNDLFLEFSPGERENADPQVYRLNHATTLTSDAPVAYSEHYANSPA